MLTLNTNKVKVVKVVKAKAANRAMTTITRVMASNSKVDMVASNKVDMMTNNKVGMMISNKVVMVNNNRVDTAVNNNREVTMTRINMEVNNRAEDMAANNRVDTASNNKVDTVNNRVDTVNNRVDTVKTREELTLATIKAPVMVCPVLQLTLIVGGHGGRAQGGAPPTQGGWQGDFSGATNVAQQHAGDSADKGMFSQAIQHMQSGNHTGPVNEQDALNAHQQVYGQGGGAGGVAAGSIGTAAALQALKGMLSGGGTNSPC
jgi:hypothetical protein